MSKEFYNDGKYIFINTPYAEAYIPDEIFDKPTEDPKNSTLTYDTGTELVALGVFYMKFFDVEEDEVTEQIRAKTPLRTLNYPTLIEAKPSGAATKQKLELNGEVDTYRIFRFEKGDILMDAKTKKDATNVELYTKLIMSGKLPRSLSYEDLYFSWKRCFEINGVNARIPPVLMQAIIARMCRVKGQPTQQYRMVAGKNRNTNSRGYQMLSMNQVSAYSSTVASMAFERFAEKLTTSLTMTKDGANQEESPIDKIITM